MLFRSVFAAVPEAVLSAGDYVSAAIASSYPLGGGSGPVNHFHALVPRYLPLPNSFSPQPFTDYLINYNPDVWRRYVHHPFPIALGAGTASLSSFLHFIEQDYHFLKASCSESFVAFVLTSFSSNTEGRTHSQRTRLNRLRTWLPRWSCAYSLASCLPS